MPTPHAPLVLDAAAVAALLPQVDALAAMRRLFTELGRGDAVQPAQSLTLLPGGQGFQGDFITYQGASHGAQMFGAKLSPYLPREDGAIVTAWTVLMSSETGLPLMLCDAGRLTVERTAATTALAVDHLGAAAAHRLAIIGSGAVAEAHLRHVLPLRDWQAVQVFSPSLQGAERADHWRGLDPRVTVAQSADAAIAGADVVMLCTSSGQPVVDTTDVKPGILVTSISTNVARAHEVAPAFLNDAEVYCDYRATTPVTAGEMVIAGEQGWDAGAIRGDLAELQCGQCPYPSGDRPVFFRSIGLGLEDIFMAEAVYQAARSAE